MRQPNPFRISDNKALQYLSLTVRLGLTMALSILICFYVAWRLEEKVQSGGLLLAAGVLLGVVAGGWASYRMTLKQLAPPDETSSDNEDLS